MPIHISEYTWYQTAEKVTFCLDLHHISPKNVDIVTTSSYLKVNFMPYIFEAFLCGRVDVSHSRARAEGGHLKLDLVKVCADTWTDACMQLTPEEKSARRQEAGIELEEQEKMRLKQEKEERIKRDRFAVSQQISTDEMVRNERKKIIERTKIEFFNKKEPADLQPAEEENNERKQMGTKICDKQVEQKTESKEEIKELGNEEIGSKAASTRRRWSSAGSEDGVGAQSAGEHDYDGDGEDSSIHYSSSENIHQLHKNDKIEGMARKQRKSNLNRKGVGQDKEGKLARDEKDKKSQVEGKGEKESEEIKRKGRRKKNTLPPVRPSERICTSHTPRAFPTPSRESTQEEETQWLASQSIAKPPDKGSSDSSDSTSSTLEHFRKKIVFLFQNGDYVGCVNACTEALTLAPASPAFYSNRAASNIAIGNLQHAISDCSKALELLIPKTQENLKSRLLCHVRRGTAFVRLGLVSKGGLADYEAALALTPDDTSLQQDVARLREMVQRCDSENESDSGLEDGHENSVKT